MHDEVHMSTVGHGYCGFSHAVLDLQCVAPASCSYSSSSQTLQCSLSEHLSFTPSSWCSRAGAYFTVFKVHDVPLDSKSSCSSGRFFAIAYVLPNFTLRCYSYFFLMTFFLTATYPTLLSPMPNCLLCRKGETGGRTARGRTLCERKVYVLFVHDSI